MQVVQSQQPVPKSHCEHSRTRSEMCWQIGENRQGHSYFALRTYSYAPVARVRVDHCLDCKKVLGVRNA